MNTVISIDADTNEIYAKFMCKPGRVESPDGKGWFLLAVTAEGPGGSDEIGGLWTVWARVAVKAANEVAP